MSPQPKNPALTPKDENQAIREAVLKAVAVEEAIAPFNLSGRGHEPRLKLDRRLAAILRGVEIPAAYISGYGANSFYPTRVFVRAVDILTTRLGWSPMVVYKSEPQSASRLERPGPPQSAQTTNA